MLLDGIEIGETIPPFLAILFQILNIILNFD